VPAINPFESPDDEPGQNTAEGLLSGRRDDLKKVASAQKGILICILLYLAVVAVKVVAFPEVTLFNRLQVWILAGVWILVIFAGIFFVIRLSILVYGLAQGIMGSSGYLVGRNGRK